MPEGRAHRRMALLVQAAASALLGEAAQVEGNLNWYPRDGGSPVAPDVMVLPAGTLEPQATSYQQADGQPFPSVVVEIPSASDGYPDFVGKLRRYQALGTVVYVFVVHDGALDATRFAPGDDEPVRWLGRPCPELGGLVVKVDDDRLVVWLPTGGITVGSEPELTAALRDQAERAAARAATAEDRAATAEAEAERLRRLLASHGIDA